MKERQLINFTGLHYVEAIDELEQPAVWTPNGKEYVVPSDKIVLIEGHEEDQDVTTIVLLDGRELNVKGNLYDICRQVAGSFLRETGVAT
jgi:hypothetical protein